MNQRDKIAQMLIDDPSLRQRKFRYILASRITGIDPETCRIVASVLDEYRHQTQVDEVGEALEKTFHKPQYLFGQDNQTIKMSKRLSEDLLKYN